MTAQLIKTLPRFAEEQGGFYAVSREQLYAALNEQAHVERAVAENTVDLCELLIR